MKKPNIIAGAIVATVLISYISYVALQNKRKQDNIFLNKNNFEVNTLIPEEALQKNLRYKEKSFTFKDLPVDIQKRIKNEQLKAHISINTILKDVLIRYHAVSKGNPNYKEIDLKDLPPLAEVAKMRVKKDRIEEAYQKNKDNFPLDHDPMEVKSAIGVELYTEDLYKLMLGYLAEIYKSTDSALPVSPQINEEWILTKDFLPTYGEPSAPNHLIWIGHYGCPECSGFTQDLGLLIQKYSLKEIKVTFIPWTKNDVDAYSWLLVTSFCVRKKVSLEKFWAFHSLAMNKSDSLVGMKNNDLKMAKEFAKGIMKSIDLSEDNMKNVFTCSEVMNETNETLMKIVEAKKKVSFIPNLNSPTAIFNGHLLDLEGVRLFLKLDKLLKKQLK